MNLEALQEDILNVPNFPKPGIVFKDITPILESPTHFKFLIEEMGKRIPKEVTKLVGIESRGFILASALAYHKSKGLVLCRKPGKLPRETHSQSFDLEYGQDTLEIHTSALSPNDCILIVDDVLATGGTAEAAAKLCQKSACKIMGFLFLMELKFLNGRAKLKQNSESLLTF